MSRLLKCAAVVPLAVGALLFGLVLPVSVAAADPPPVHGQHGHFFKPHGPHGFFHGHLYNCTGGTIPAGVYGSIVVTGVCFMPSGNITVQGNVTVAPGALLDAVTKGDPATDPVVPATVNIGGNVTVGKGGVFLFGCSPNITCTSPPGITYDHIQGSLTAFGAQGVVVHSAVIGGNVTVVGGGGGAAAETCSAQTAKTPTPLATLEPWSEDPGLYYVPVYTDFEDSTIGGNYTVSGLTSCWLGTLRDQIGGAATFANNTMGDPDAMEIDNNLVGGNMVCLANSPAVGFHDSGSAPNIVRGIGIGQCGFGVTQPNPFAYHTTTTKTTIPAGPAEHVTVPQSSLQTFTGTYTSETVKTLTIATTESGDHIVAALGDFTIAGSGLTGSGTYTPTLPPGHTGSALLATVYPNGTESFTLYLNCDCSFGGQTGTIRIRAYGTTSRQGYTSGTFFITSGGTPSGALEMLAGWGTFNNFGEPTGTVRILEHLAIT